MRKQAFASVCLFGSEADSTISGVWIWRGQDLAFEVKIKYILFCRTCIIITICNDFLDEQRLESRLRCLHMEEIGC